MNNSFDEIGEDGVFIWNVKLQICRQTSMMSIFIAVAFYLIRKHMYCQCVEVKDLFLIFQIFPVMLFAIWFI